MPFSTSFLFPNNSLAINIFQFSEIHCPILFSKKPFFFYNLFSEFSQLTYSSSCPLLFRNPFSDQLLHSVLINVGIKLESTKYSKMNHFDLVYNKCICQSLKLTYPISHETLHNPVLILLC